MFLELERRVLSTGNDPSRGQDRGCHRPIRPDWAIDALDEGFVPFYVYGEVVFPSPSSL